jgi:carotene epsilon-monooxygenase
VTGKNIDAAGAGASSISPGWLTQLNLLWGGKGVSGGLGQGARA